MRSVTAVVSPCYTMKVIFIRNLGYVVVTASKNLIELRLGRGDYQS